MAAFLSLLSDLYIDSMNIFRNMERLIYGLILLLKSLRFLHKLTFIRAYVVSFTMFSRTVFSFLLAIILHGSLHFSTSFLRIFPSMSVMIICLTFESLIISRDSAGFSSVHAMNALSDRLEWPSFRGRHFISSVSLS